jgi:hypothetical protein
MLVAASVISHTSSWRGASLINQSKITPTLPEAQIKSRQSTQKGSSKRKIEHDIRYIYSCNINMYKTSLKYSWICWKQNYVTQIQSIKGKDWSKMRVTLNPVPPLTWRSSYRQCFSLLSQNKALIAVETQRYWKKEEWFSPVFLLRKCCVLSDPQGHQYFRYGSYSNMKISALSELKLIAVRCKRSWCTRRISAYSFPCRDG